MNQDILNEISNHLDLKSIIMLYATTLHMNQLCDNEYWKRLYHKCYCDKHYKSKEFNLTQYKYKNSLADTITLYRKYTDKDYVITYHTTSQLSKKLNKPIYVKNELLLRSKSISIFHPEISKLWMLKVLILNGNQLTVIPSSICNMTNLKYLDLARNNISELPKEIGLLIKLHTFDIQNNQIKTLPNEISMLTNLMYLDCSRNKLITLPEMAPLTKLKRLYLHDNQLTSIPNMTSLVNLKCISLDGNSLSVNVSSITSTKLYSSTRRNLLLFKND